MSPEVSVIIPAYNCEPYIAQSVGSILDQTVKDVEVLICDDGSTDKTWQVIEGFSDSRIRKFRNKVNMGVLRTQNFLLSKVSGMLVTGQDADDWSEPDRLETQVTVFRERQDVLACGINGSFYYDPQTIYPCPKFEDGYIVNRDTNYPFILPALMYRREVLDTVKGYHLYFDRLTSMDQYFIFNIVDKFRTYAVNKYLYTHRFHHGSNHRTFDTPRKLTAHEAFLLLRKQRLQTGSDWLMEGREKDLIAYEESFLRDRGFMAEKYREYAVYDIDAGHVAKSIPLLFRSFVSNPLYLKSYRTMAYALRRSVGLR